MYECKTLCTVLDLVCYGMFLSFLISNGLGHEM